MAFVETDSPVKIMNEQKNELEKEITRNEFSVALKETKNGTSPGLDGWTSDFYKMFYYHLREPLFEAFMYCIKAKRLFASARRGVLTLLPKLGQDILLIKNWRLISLLGVDYKLYAKVLANRLKTTLNTVISNNQSGFVKGRNIVDNARRAIDIMQITTKEKIGALLISLDLEKAFDRVDYQALFKCMEFFGFGEKFIYYNTLLFKDFNLCTANAGHLSSFWSPTRGIFQGNPNGSYLFLLIMEIFAINLKKNPKIEGIVVNHIRYLLAQFADNMDLFIKYKREVWEEVIREISKFEQNTGMKVNYEKTTVYRLGSLKNSNAKFYSEKKINWVNGPVNVLGVNISHNFEEMTRLNLEPLFTRMENTLKIW